MVTNFIIFLAINVTAGEDRENRFILNNIFFGSNGPKRLTMQIQFRQAMDDFTYQMDKKEHDQSRPQDYTLSEYQSNLDLKQSTPNNQDELSLISAR